MSILSKLLVIKFVFFTIEISFAQNTWGPLTRPITRLHSAVAPSSIGFENNLMNHISDNLRVDTPEIAKPISCVGDESGTIVHRKGGRVIPIQCHGGDLLNEIKSKVSHFYGHEIGMHLKYAFKSGPYIFAICNYDESSDHNHNDHHYVCRTPVSGESKLGDMETYCYEMGFFHRTCNPHKALVSTEIIPINSRRRWAHMDLTLLLRFLNNSPEAFTLGSEPGDLVSSLSSSKVSYASYTRGSPDAVARYPKVFVGDERACIETLLSSTGPYVLTDIVCGSYRQIGFGNRASVEIDEIVFRKQMSRLKQVSVHYHLIGNERSSVD